MAFLGSLMRPLISTFAFSLCAALTLLSAGLASADDAGPLGRVVTVRIHETSSDDAANFRGSVTIRSGGKNNRELAEYRWGGNQCPGRNLSEENVDRLLEALSESDDLRVTPSFKSGNGGAKCLTAFEITHRNAVSGPAPE